MIYGHGDDRWRYGHIAADFSSNVYYGADNSALLDYLRGHIEDILHYPEPVPHSLEERIAQAYGLDQGTVCVTGGATEAIYLIAQAFAGSQSAIFQPAFSEYSDACHQYGHFVKHIFPQADLFSGDGIISEAQIPDGTQMCWICNPCNPTGHIYANELVERLIASHPGCIFVMDQSYAAFTEYPLPSPAHLAAHPNLLVLHSLTKSHAVPGLRLGWITGSARLLERVRSCRMPWSVNALAVAAGMFFAEEIGSSLQTRGRLAGLDGLLEECRRLRESIASLEGLRVAPTHSHFFLCRTENSTAAELKDYLAREQGVLIRDASNFPGLDVGCFRIATQKPEFNKILLSGLNSFISTNK